MSWIVETPHFGFLLSYSVKLFLEHYPPCPVVESIFPLFVGEIPRLLLPRPRLSIYSLPDVAGPAPSSFASILPEVPPGGDNLASPKPPAKFPFYSIG